MTRKNLIGAIYDNEEEWSCAYTCPHTMEEENPEEVCWRCAEKQLAEYEQQIRAEVFKELAPLFEDIVTMDNICEALDGEWCEKNCGNTDKCLAKYVEQLKEQNK